MKITTKQEELTDKYGTKPSDLPQLHIIGYERSQEYKKLFHMNEKPTEVIKKPYAKFTEMGGVLVDFDKEELVDAKGQKLLEDYDDDLKGVNFNKAYSDIIFNNTLPSPNLLMDAGEAGMCQVCLADRDYILKTLYDYLKILDEHPDCKDEQIEWYPAPIGAVKIIISERQIVCGLLCLGDRGSTLTLSSEVMLLGSDFTSFTKKLDDPYFMYEYEINPELNYMLFIALTKAATFLHAWYASQILLMNPILKEHIKRITVPMPEMICGKSNGKKSPKKYIKSIIINENDLEELQICSSSIGKRKYKEPVWYVMGHWRHYKSGKRIFIQGYWKGPEKYRKVLQEPRERELQDTEFFPYIND